MFNHKTIKKSVYWCNKCNTEIAGNGSIITPYKCKCGTYEYIDTDDRWEMGEYRIKT